LGDLSVSAHSVKRHWNLALLGLEPLVKRHEPYKKQQRNSLSRLQSPCESKIISSIVTERAKKIEANVGLILVLANCFRISFWQHGGPRWFVTTCDLIALLGFVFYLHGKFIKASTT
jgi:hypothetical protein